MGPAPRLLFVLDLDYTYFNTAKKDVTWLGSEYDWLAFYEMCRQVALHKGIVLMFAVVTNKPHFDDIADEAAKAFKPLLSINNPAMYVDGHDTNWCLVKHDKQLRYECLSEDKSVFCHFTNVISHFVVVPNKNKAPYIREIADFYEIEPENCLVLDDTPDVLLDVTLNGMRTVGFEAFNPNSMTDRKLLEVPDYVERILQDKRFEIWEKLQTMMQAITMKVSLDSKSQSLDSENRALTRKRSYDHAFVSDAFMEVINEFDPQDCLHSWGSFRLLQGNTSYFPTEETVQKAPSLSLLTISPPRSL